MAKLIYRIPDLEACEKRACEPEVAEHAPGGQTQPQATFSSNPSSEDEFPDTFSEMLWSTRVYIISIVTIYIYIYFFLFFFRRFRFGRKDGGGDSLLSYNHTVKPCMS